MTYHELFKYIKERCINADVSKFSSDTSYQFNVRGEGEGAFYAEVKNGVLSVEPYEYYDRDVIFEADSKVLIDIADKVLDATEAILSGSLKFTGNNEKAMELKKLFAEEKPVEKKAEKKKTVKSEEKTAEKKTTVKAEEKTAEKKTTVKVETKTAEKKTEEKPVEKKAETKTPVKKTASSKKSKKK